MKKYLISRRSFLQAAGTALATLLVPKFLWGKTGREKTVAYLKNESLPVLMKGYRGNPFINGKFVNEVSKPRVTLADIMKWRFSKNPQKEEKKRDSFSLAVRKDNTFFDKKEDILVWLGHATWFIRMDGVSFLTDPCLENPIFVKRLSALPCGIEDIRNVDYLLVSHSHRDHLDENSIKKMKFKNTTALLPLKMGPILREWDETLLVQEAGWYQSYRLKGPGPEVSLMPAQHWSQRSTNDENRVLWGSYIIRGSRKTLYFAGDTASAPHFKKIAELYPQIDIALMPIGAYKPAYIMKGSHITPEEAVRAYGHLKAKTFIPMHYGTFDLADEPLGEPLRRLKNMTAKGKVKGDVMIPDVGEVVYL